MRTVGICGLLLLAQIYALAQQPVARIKSLSLEAHESGTVSTYDVFWQTDWGDYDRDNHQAKKLVITVHDMSRSVSRVDVEIFFIAQDAGTGDWLIYKRTQVPVAMNGQIEVTGYVQSPVIRLHEQNYAVLGIQRASGLKMIGWIVRGKFQGRVFQTRASNQTLLEIAEGNPRQPFNLADLIQASQD